jgi:hypothetical protein
MNTLKMVPMGAALLALGLGLSSAVPPRALARDEAGNSDGRVRIWTAQEDRDNDKDDAGYLGVQVQRLSASLRRAKGIPESTEGTLVSSVEDQSPADEGGIKRGDVILSVDHQDTPNPADLVRLVRGLDPGRRVSVQVWRDGMTRTYTLKVGSRPAGSDMPMPPPNWGGQGNDDPQMPDGPRMQILRRNRDDLERQIHDLQTQIARLESEVQALQQQMNRRDHDDNDHDRKNNDRDRDRDNNNDNDGD